MSHYERKLPNGDVLTYSVMTFGKGRLTVGDGYFVDNSWCYEDYARGLIEYANWDGEGEPEGWTRHVQSGRRRPGGDKTKEYILE